MTRSLGRHSPNLNGPVPTGLRPNSSGPTFSKATLEIGNVYCALSVPALSCSASEGAGVTRLILTVYGSTIVTGFFGSRLPNTLAASDLGSPIMRSTFHFSESAFHGLPSWKVTPLRSCQMAVVSVGEKSHRSIKPGATPHAPRSSRRKKKSGSNTMNAAEPLAEL